MVEKVSKFSPNSKTNHTEINIRLVFNVAGLLKKQIDLINGWLAMNIK